MFYSVSVCLVLPDGHGLRPGTAVAQSIRQPSLKIHVRSPMCRFGFAFFFLGSPQNSEFDERATQSNRANLIVLNVTVLNDWNNCINKRRLAVMLSDSVRLCGLGSFGNTSIRSGYFWIEIIHFGGNKPGYIQVWAAQAQQSKCLSHFAWRRCSSSLPFCTTCSTCCSAVEQQILCASKWRRKWFSLIQ